MEGLRRFVPIGVALAIGVMATGGQPLDSFQDFVLYLASPAALGVISSLVLQVIRKQWPQIDGQIAFVWSIGMALVFGVGATLLLPNLEQLPPEVEQYWPFVVWFMQQVWYWLMKERDAIAGLYKGEKVPA